MDSATLKKMMVMVLPRDQEITIRCGCFNRFKQAVDQHFGTSKPDRVSDTLRAFAGVPVEEDWRLPANIVVVKSGDELLFMNLNYEG